LRKADRSLPRGRITLNWIATIDSNEERIKIEEPYKKYRRFVLLPIFE